LLVPHSGCKKSFDQPGGFLLIVTYDAGKFSMELFWDLPMREAVVFPEKMSLLLLHTRDCCSKYTITVLVHRPLQKDRKNVF